MKSKAKNFKLSKQVNKLIYQISACRRKPVSNISLLSQNTEPDDDAYCKCAPYPRIVATPLLLYNYLD